MSSGSDKSTSTPREYYLDGGLLLNHHKMNGICDMCERSGVTQVDDRMFCLTHSVEHQILTRWLNGKCNNSMKVYISYLRLKRDDQVTYMGHKLCDYPGCCYYGDLISAKRDDLVVFFCANHHRLHLRSQSRHRSLSRSSPGQHQSMEKNNQATLTNRTNSEPRTISPRKERLPPPAVNHPLSYPPGFEPPPRISPILQLIVFRLRNNQITLNDYNFKHFMSLTLPPEQERYLINAVFDFHA